MIRFSPRPNTRGRPERRAVCRIRSQYSSMNAPARTIVQGVPESRSRSSATAFIRNSSIGSVGDAPSTDMRTTCAFRAAAASIRQALPSRSTDAGVTPPCAAGGPGCGRRRAALMDRHLCASAVPVGRTNSHGHGLDGDHPPRPAPGFMEALIRRKDESPDGTANHGLVLD
jgi:hypothetical protein